MAGEPKAVVAVTRPSIPVRQLKVDWSWVLIYLGSVLCIWGCYFFYARAIHTTIVLPLGEGGLTSLVARTQGCDVFFRQSTTPEVRLNFWSFMGTGSVEMIKTTNTVNISADVTRKIRAFQCTLTVSLPYSSPAKPALHNLHLTVEASAAERQLTEPGNVVEIIAVSLTDVHVKNQMHVHVTAKSQIEILGGSTNELVVETIGGGTVALNDIYSDAPLAKSITILADYAMVSVQLRHSDITAELDNDVFRASTLAGANVTKAGDKYSLSRNLPKDKNTTSLTVNGTDSSVYIMARGYDMDSIAEGECPKLETMRGDAVTDTPAFTAHGKHIIEDLNTWLKVSSNAQTFVAHMNFPTLAGPQGTMTLVSSEVYSGRAVTSLSLVSASMLQPTLIRISFPLLGGSQWPCPSNGRVATSGDILGMLDDVIDLKALGMVNAKWTWTDSETKKTSAFDHVKTGKATFEWRPRVISGTLAPIFLLCMLLTLLVGTMIGGAVFMFLYKVVRPRLLEHIRDHEITRTSSYRLLHSYEPITWVIQTTVTQWPMTGNFIRWRKRPLANLVSKAEVAVRSWPVGQDQGFKSPKFDPSLLPTMPNFPDNQCYLFPTIPGKRKEKCPWFPNDFDTDLYKVGLTQYGIGQKALKVGMAYQFRVTSYNERGEVVESSAWSRPQLAQATRDFTEYPLMMWKAWYGMLPEKSFKNFLDAHCLPVEASPSLTIILSNLRLLVVNSGGLLFNGLPQGTREDDYQKVIVTASTNASVNPLCVMTDDAFLPTQQQRIDNRLAKPYGQIAPEYAGGGYTPATTTTFVEINFDRSVELTLPVAYDRSSVMTIEAALISVDGLAESTASISLSWESLISMVNKPAAKPTQVTSIRAQPIILREGLTPAAVLLADATFKNSIFGLSTPPTLSAGFTDVFKNLLPCSTVLYGESMSLTWLAGAGAKFDIVLVARGFNRPNIKAYHNKLASRSTVVVCSDVNPGDGKCIFIAIPDMPFTEQFMRCHLEAVGKQPAARGPSVLARSAQFAVSRPVTFQSLELGYAAYCVHQKIPMQAIPTSMLTSVQHERNIEICQRNFQMSDGYRSPLPFEILPGGFASPDKGVDIVANATSKLICDKTGLSVSFVDFADRTSKPDAKTKQANGLSAPLLEGGEMKEEDTNGKPTTVHPRSELIDIPTNVFWDWDHAWSAEILLKYAFLPAFAQDGYFFSFFGPIFADCVGDQCMKFLEEVLLDVDKLVRFALRLILFAVQVLLMAFPSIVLVCTWLYHDWVSSQSNDDIRPSAGQSHLFLSGFIIDPTADRWNQLDASSQVVGGIALAYLVFVVCMTCYGNFFHPVAHKEYLHQYMNLLVMSLWSLSVFFLVFILVVILLWIVVGALVKPMALLPFAIMVIGIVILVMTLHGKLDQMRVYIEGRIHEMLDHAMNAITDVFLAQPTCASDIASAIAKFHTIGAIAMEYMAQEESKQSDLLLKASGIQDIVTTEERSRIKTLRSTTYFSTVEGKGKNKALCTDFLPSTDKEGFLKAAQKIANDDAEIASTVVYDGGVRLDADITAEHCREAAAEATKEMIPKPGDFSPEELVMVTAISTNLGISTKTTTSVYDAYRTGVNIERGRAMALLDPTSCATLFSKIRQEQLYSHFIEVEIEYGGKMIKTSGARQMFIELQRSQHQGLSVIATKAMTARVDWMKLRKGARGFVNSTLPGMILCAASSRQLTTHIHGSVAYTLDRRMADLIYEKWDAVYSKTPLQALGDLGIVSQRYAQKPETKAIFTTCINDARCFDDSLTPDGLIGAIKAMLLPNHQPAKKDAQAVYTFLWYDALVEILKDLGWAEEEMAAPWLEAWWEDATGGIGLLAYQGKVEVDLKVSSLANGGLWKSAAQAVFHTIGLAGYVSCDIKRLGKEKAAALAHKISDAHKTGECTDLKEIAAVLDWPPFMEEIWQRHAKPGAVGKIEGPRFLGLETIQVFLEDIVYLNDVVAPDLEKLVKLNPYSEDVCDLVWHQDTETGCVWHLYNGSYRKLRGMWLELTMDIFDLASHLPSDLDVYFECLTYQLEQESHTEQWLRLDSFFKWAQNSFNHENDWTSFEVFCTLLTQKLKVNIPVDVLRDQVFTPCPVRPDDDKGELRKLSDLGAALSIWMGFGLWQGAVAQCVKTLWTNGQKRDLALSMLPEEFAKMDADGLGIVQPCEALILIQRLSVPGFDCDALEGFLRDSLGIQVPPAQLHKCFTMIDLNGDGVMQAEEFVLMVRFILLDFYPRLICEQMNLTTGKILKFILTIVTVLGLIFGLISLVLQAFAVQSAGSAAAHSSVNAIVAMAGKKFSETSIGVEDTMANYFKVLEQTLVTTLASVLGMSKPVIDRFVSFLKGAVA